MHVSRDALEPGDLVFFYADISHVGIYLGNGLMVAAPRTGENVKVQPINWSIYVGAVRIALSPRGANQPPFEPPASATSVRILGGRRGTGRSRGCSPRSA